MFLKRDVFGEVWHGGWEGSLSWPTDLGSNLDATTSRLHGPGEVVETP